MTRSEAFAKERELNTRAFENMEPYQYGANLVKGKWKVLKFKKSKGKFALV